MKKLMIGSAMSLAAALSNAFGNLGEFAQPVTRSRGKGRGKARSLNLYIRKSRPTDQRHWHNINDPVQRQRLQAAEQKRERRAEKLYRDIKCSMRWNGAHKTGVIEQLGKVISDTPARLNPLYVNRGEVV